MKLKTLCKLAAYVAFLAAAAAVGYIFYEQATLPQAPSLTHGYPIDAGKGPMLYGTAQEHLFNIAAYYTAIGGMILGIILAGTSYNMDDKNKP